MFSKEEILAQLRAGTDASDIAQKMADEINAAVHDYEAEQERAKRDSMRREDARNMICAMADFFAKHMDEEPMDEADIDSATDAVMELVDSLKELRATLENANGTLNIELKKADRDPSVNRKETPDEEIIRRFLNTL